MELNVKKEADLKLSEQRQKLFSDSKFQPNNQKYGLFSYTGTLAISDRPYFSKTQVRRDKDGNVEISPHNFLASPSKKGKTPDVYFSLPQYSSDAYMDPSKPYIKEKERATIMNQKHPNLPWKPARVKAEPISLFPHEASEVFMKKSKKGPDGKVVVGPRNFLTSPPKKGIASTTPGLLLAPLHEYIPDPYERKKKLEYEEMVKSKAKMQSQSFKSADHGGRTFADDQKTFGGEFNLSKTQRVVRSPKQNFPPFYPPNRGNSDAFGKYPEHIPDERVNISKSPVGDKPAWKSTTNLRTIPSPSISYSFKNLRTEFPVLKRLA